MIYTTKNGGNASGWPWLKYFLKAESRHFSSLHGPLTSCKKSEKTYENFCDGLTDRCDKTQYVSSKMRERTMFFGGSLVVLHNNDSVFYRGGVYVAKYSLLWKDAVIRIVGSQGIFFWIKFIYFENKKNEWCAAQKWCARGPEPSYFFLPRLRRCVSLETNAVLSYSLCVVSLSGTPEASPICTCTRARVFNCLFLVASFLKYRVGRSVSNKKRFWGKNEYVDFGWKECSMTAHPPIRDCLSLHNLS